MSQFIIIETTTGTRQEADAIAEQLVQNRIAACVQINGPIKSVYRWEDAVEFSEEFRCRIKTRQSLFEQATELIQELHSYDEPQIVAWPITDGSVGYLQWMQQETLDPEQQN